MRRTLLITAFYLFYLSTGKAQVISNWKDLVVLDGKLDEWNEKKFRYDESTWLWFNIANDENFIYLAVRKSKHVGKIYYSGGLKFTINRNGKKQRAGEPWVTFPRAVEGLKKVPESEWTLIEVGNFESIKEEKLNIYNEYGIQVGWTKFRLDGDLEDTYCYELAIPISLLDIQNKQEICFNILLRGVSEMAPDRNPGVLTRVTLDHVNHIPNLSREEKEVIVRNANDIDWTEVWGKYRLAEKP